MEYSELLPLLENYHRKIAKVDLRFKRYLYYQINWNSRMIGVKGARGVGKTTMLLQHILESYDDIDKTIYASLDDLWFSSHTLMELVNWAFNHGIMRLYLDEVHRYENWSSNLKNIYDNYPEMSVVYTSSSLLKVDNATVDLSRRQTLYTLYGMSFREYLAFEGVINLDPIPLNDLLQHHVTYAMNIIKQIKVIPFYESYLQHGYYPFYKEAGLDFVIRLRETLSVVIDTDLPAVEKVSFETIQKIKRLLMIISENVPFEPNMSQLWKQVATNNELGLRMLYALDRAQILGLLTSKIKSYKYLFKPDKIFLENPNLMHALCTKVEKGNERETFFYSQLFVAHELKSPKQGDFLVDDRFLFEVGGPHKTFDQVADLPDSFLAIDEIEVGHGARVPLWMLGLLY